MARGSGTTGYRGAIGRTRTERMHYTCPGGGVKPIEVYRCVNAATHPELAVRMKDGDPRAWVNAVDCGGQPCPVHASVVYHDPAAEVFALVLSESARHTELGERASLLALLAADTEYELPRYVRDFDVVYGPSELASYLEARADREMRAAREAELEAELERRKARLDDDERAFAARRAELERVVAELDARKRELEARAAAEPAAPVAQLPAVTAKRAAAPTGKSAAKPAGATPEIASPVRRDADGTPLPQPIPHEDIETNPVELLSARELQELERQGFDPTRARKSNVVILDSPFDPVDDDDDGDVQAVGADQLLEEEDSEQDIRAQTDPTLTSTRVGGTHDVTLERWIASREPTLATAVDGRVRLAATVGASALDRVRGDDMPVRVQLHRMPSYPLVAIALGKRPEPFCFLFDVAAADDRAVLSALARDFAFTLHLFDTQYLPVEEREVRAPLADNVRYLLTAADEHLRGIARNQRSFARAEIAWSDPDFDRHGLRRPERALYRDELLDRLDTAAQVREAVQMAAHFSKPELEELLVLVWSEPLDRWNKRRGRVVLRAVELGLWPGPELAQIAVSVGVARSRKDLAQKLERGFQRTLSSSANDLDAEAIEANWQALRAQGQSERGASEGTRPKAIGGDPNSRDVVSGTIGEAPARKRRDTTAPAPVPEGPARDLSSEQVVALLSDKDRRREAALELCRRAEPAGLGPIFAALTAMTRAEAVQVLGQMVRYGPDAQPHLLQGLQSRKGFIRQGCALALAVQKSEPGIEAICDLLLSEPTEIWRELARAVGELGAGAVMSLVARLREAPDARRERVAWALAHVAARGTAAPIQTLAQGRDPTAAGVARHALELADLARNDDHSVRGPTAPRDQTVNRAFSRKFFEAMNQIGRASGDESGVVPLDDADLIEDDAELLDDSDLIPSEA